MDRQADNEQEVLPGSTREQTPAASSTTSSPLAGPAEPATHEQEPSSGPVPDDEIQKEQQPPLAGPAEPATHEQEPSSGPVSEEAEGSLKSTDSLDEEVTRAPFKASWFTWLGVIVFTLAVWAVNILSFPKIGFYAVAVLGASTVGVGGVLQLVPDRAALSKGVRTRPARLAGLALSVLGWAKHAGNVSVAVGGILLTWVAWQAYFDSLLPHAP